MMNDSTQQFYETHANEYEQKTKDLQPVEFTTLFIEKLAEHARVLDIGCAFGRDALTFAEAGLRVTGIDYSHALLERARSLVPQAIFIRQDMRSLDFAASSFDGIWANMSLLHIRKSELPEVLHTLRLILNSYGVLALGLKIGEGEACEHDRRYDGAKKYYAYFSQSEIYELLQCAGFTIESFVIKECAVPYQDKPAMELIARKNS